LSAPIDTAHGVNGASTASLKAWMRSEASKNTMLGRCSIDRVNRNRCQTVHTPLPARMTGTSDGGAGISKRPGECD
jgi:hypothetical protein